MKTLIKMSLTAVACGLVLAGPVYGDALKRIDVPAGDLVAALEALAKQAEVNLVYPAGQMQGLMTKGVSGTFTPREAVAKLLRGTSLHLNIDEATGAMMISSDPPNKISADGSQGGDEKLWVAQN